VIDTTAMERGSFAAASYEAVVRRNPDRIQVMLSHDGNAWGIPFTLSKAITLEAGSNVIEIAYQLDRLPRDFRQHFAVEFNFAGMPAATAGRFFHDGAGRELGELGSQLDLCDVRSIGLVDDWLDIDATLWLSRPSGLWTFPIGSVSQSEGGFELVHQSVVVMPHWIVTPDADGSWKVGMRLSLDSHRDADRIPRQTRAAAFAT
jgi:alpha-amylase